VSVHPLGYFPAQAVSVCHPEEPRDRKAGSAFQAGAPCSCPLLVKVIRSNLPGDAEMNTQNGGTIGSVSLSAETTEHLERVETAIRRAKGLLGGHSYPDDLRTVVVAAFIDQMIEHHEALLLLIRSGKVGSAFALFRSIFEGMYRGLWINFCATDNELKKFEKDDEIPLTMAEMSKAIDEKYLAHGFYADLKKRGWKALTVTLTPVCSS